MSASLSNPSSLQDSSKLPHSDTSYISSSSTWSLPSTSFHPNLPSLPLAFKLFNHKKLTLVSFNLAHTQQNPVLAISGSSRTLLHPHASITLHSGPDSTSPALGSVTIKTQSLIVHLPSSGSVPEQDIHLHELNASFWQKLKSSGTEFGFELNNNTQQKFEWRRSKSAEVEDLHGEGGKHGWILVRVGARDGEEEEEVVAAFAMNVMSTTVAGNFAFLNSGATEELGAAFALTAVLSALGMNYIRREAYVVGGVTIDSTGD